MCLAQLDIELQKICQICNLPFHTSAQPMSQEEVCYIVQYQTCDLVTCVLTYIYIYETENSLFLENRIGGVMVSMLALSAVDCEFQPRSLQIKDYKIGICFFFAKHAALKRQQRLVGATYLSAYCCFSQLAL